MLLGAVGVRIWPILATDSLISLPAVPMSVVQSVIPISALLIVIAELTYLVELITLADARRATAGVSTADELQ